VFFFSGAPAVITGVGRHSTCLRYWCQYEPNENIWNTNTSKMHSWSFF